MTKIQVANRGNGVEIVSQNEIICGDVFRRNDYEDWKTAICQMGKLSLSYLPVGYAFTDIYATLFRDGDLVYGHCLSCSKNKPVPYNKDFCPKCIKEGKSWR